MAKKKNTSKSWHHKKLNKKTSFAILAFIVILYSGIIYSYYWSSFFETGYGSRVLYQTIYWDILGIINKYPSDPVIAPQNIPALTLTPTPTELPLKTAEYTSSKLGISFQYATFIPNHMAVDGGQYFYVREIGNKIYLYWTAGISKPFEGSDGQFENRRGPALGSKYIEIFNKDPNLTLSNAIKQYIFRGTIPSQCYISTNTRYGELNINTSYQQAVILHYSTPTTKAFSYLESEKYFAICYTLNNYVGKSYFMMDLQHPNKFLFINLGEDDIPSGYKGYMWDGTITIF